MGRLEYPISEAQEVDPQRDDVGVDSNGEPANISTKQPYPEASQQDAYRHLYEDEKTRRRQAEVQLEQLRGEVEHLRQSLRVREGEVRYRLGDAMVRAAKPSADTLKLPFRMMGLLLEGIRKAYGRRKAAASRATQELPITAYGAAEALHTSFGEVPSTFRSHKDLRIAAVTDEFSWWAWGFEAEIFTFRPDEWRRQLEKRSPHLLLIESAWRGIDDSWYHQLRHLRSRADETYVLPEMVAWCRSRKIPTVFYNKEDPPNFSVFIEAASNCDHIFTSDGNCIPEYVRASGNSRVYALPFAAQPRIHNPVLTAESRNESVCFAGTWYNDRHEDRRQDAISILKPALDHDLHIYDRMAGSRNKSYAWPSEFASAVRGGLAYPHMLSTYKQYKVFLNVNSVKHSPTMFSRRVFELLACGTPVISSYSTGIADLLGDDIVLMSDCPSQTHRHLERLLENDDFRDRLSLRGQRCVFGSHTYAHRLQAMLERIGWPQQPTQRPTITMIAPVASDKDAQHARLNFDRQNYRQKRLILCVMGECDSIPSAARSCDGLCNVKMVDARCGTLSNILKDIVSACEPGHLAALDPNSYYGADYLTDYANVTLYLKEPVFGKSSHYREGPHGGVQRAGSGEEYRMATRVHPATVCIERNAAIEAVAHVGDIMRICDWWNRAARSYGRVYATDRFNFVGSHDHCEDTVESGSLASSSVADVAEALV